MLRRISVLIITLLVMSNVSHAFEKVGTLRGRILDGFGKPVSFANITIVSNSSRSRVSSDPAGNFSASYSSGNVKLTFDKEGYVSQYIPLSFDEATDISLGDITLWKIPPKGGLFVVGDNAYREINNAEHYSESSSKERRFYIKGSPTVVKGREIGIIDFQTDNPLVIGKTLYRVDSKGSVGSIIFYPSRVYSLHRERDTYIKIADNVGLRRLNLPPGRYYYTIGEITIRSKNGFGFYFEISS
ncbi:MAG: carboxypeptidase regulatory-like domain-containing protein [wastewater metagenome]|nr:carboxypeptidase regulatory-like domain-containing protein [Candidatus Loosdrechtia aerotolerans]